MTARGKRTGEPRSYSNYRQPYLLYRRKLRNTPRKKSEFKLKRTKTDWRF